MQAWPGVARKGEVQHLTEVTPFYSPRNPEMWGVRGPEEEKSQLPLPTVTLGKELNLSGPQVFPLCFMETKALSTSQACEEEEMSLYI